MPELHCSILKDLSLQVFPIVSVLVLAKTKQSLVFCKALGNNRKCKVCRALEDHEMGKGLPHLSDNDDNWHLLSAYCIPSPAIRCFIWISWFNFHQNSCGSTYTWDPVIVHILHMRKWGRRDISGRVTQIRGKTRWLQSCLIQATVRKGLAN